MPRTWNAENLTEVVAQLLEKAVTDINLRGLLLNSVEAKRLIEREFETLPRDWAQRQFIFDTFGDPNGVLNRIFPALPVPPLPSEPDVNLDPYQESYRIDMSVLGAPGQRVVFKGHRPRPTTKARILWVDR